ncbi:MAG: hypothetical protein RIC55_04220 [Pirellulaceae bacterium]
MKNNLAWLLAYLALSALLVVGMFALRSWALGSYDQQSTRKDWDSWRLETQRMAQDPGPVDRRPAKSIEPPTIVLLRDHFAACLGLLLLLSSVLFATLMFMIRGVAATPPLKIEVDDEPQIPGRRESP